MTSSNILHLQYCPILSHFCLLKAVLEFLIFVTFILIYIMKEETKIILFFLCSRNKSALDWLFRSNTFLWMTFFPDRFDLTEKHIIFFPTFITRCISKEDVKCRRFESTWRRESYKKWELNVHIWWIWARNIQFGWYIVEFLY